MADHQQQQILDAISALLLASATAAGTHVFTERVDELMESELPAIHIEGGDEDVSDETIGYPALQMRRFQFFTSCIVSGADYARAARNLAKQVEAALQGTALAANGKANTLTLTGSNVQKDGTGASVLFEVRQHWIAQYITRAGTPDVLA